MFKKLKDMLGIEGVKIDLELPEKIDNSQDFFKGNVIFTTQSEQTVQSMEIKLIEKYRRGRSDSKLIDEYLLGSIAIDMDLKLEAGERQSYSFKLPYNQMLSDMDKIEDGNFIAGFFVKIAKKLKSVKSEYRVEATAKIKGTKLNPIVTKSIEIDN